MHYGDVMFFRNTADETLQAYPRAFSECSALRIYQRAGDVHANQRLFSLFERVVLRDIHSKHAKKHEL